MRSFALLFAICPLLHAQDLSLSFADHNGSITSLAVPQMRSGDLVGTLAIENPGKLYCSWAFYQNGVVSVPSFGENTWKPLAFVDPRPLSADSADDTVTSSYEVRIPFGYRDGFVNPPNVTPGDYDLVVWFTNGAMTTEMLPPASPVATFTFPFTSVATPFAVWCVNDRAFEAGESSEAFVLVNEVDKEKDHYFALSFHGAVRSDVDQIVVAAGETGSTAIPIQFASEAGSGWITATDLNTGEIITSSHLTSTYASSHAMHYRGENYRAGQYCKRGTTADPGGNTAPCGPCYNPAGGGAAGENSRCSIFGGQQNTPKLFALAYQCEPRAGKTCHIIPITLTFKKWTLEQPSQPEDCGTVATTSGGSGSGQVGIPGVGHVGGSAHSGTTVTIKLKQLCCKIKYVGTEARATATCETL